MNNAKKTTKKMTRSIIVAVVLIIFLCITTFALMVSTISIKNNQHKTGIIKINLNDGEPIIQEYDFNWRANESVARDFFIENNSTDEVYYRLYFEEVKGEMAKVMQVSIMDGEKVLYSGTAEELTRINAEVVSDPLDSGERKTLTAYFTCPEDETAAYIEDLDMSFSLCADAVQTKNNPNKAFE